MSLASSCRASILSSSRKALGCDAVRVSRSSELAPALKRGLAHEGVSLIEVTVDSAVPLLYAQKS